MLNENLKWNADGTVDVEGTLAELKPLVVRYAEMHKAQSEKISVAVESVFQEFPNDSIQLPTLAGFAAQKMGTSLPEYSETVERIKDFVRNNPKYKLGKGRAGGVRRVEAEDDSEDQDDQESGEKATGTGGR